MDTLAEDFVVDGQHRFVAMSGDLMSLEAAREKRAHERARLSELEALSATLHDVGHGTFSSPVWMPQEQLVLLINELLASFCRHYFDYYLLLIAVLIVQQLHDAI